jgi:nucleotide-binding universal stress UspA family protein
VVDADPAGAIHEAVRRWHPSVACLASHGRGRAAAITGSVATDVVARGHDPVVLVGPLFDPLPARCGVVACVDGTPAAAALLDVAVWWAQLLVEPLMVMTVAEPVPPPLAGGVVQRRFGPQGDADTWLELLTALARETLGEVDTAAVYDPISPAEGARRFLADRRPSIAVVASHARTGRSRLIHGSVAARIVYQSPSPVLVVPRPAE